MKSSIQLVMTGVTSSGQRYATLGSSRNSTRQLRLPTNRDDTPTFTSMALLVLSPPLFKDNQMYTYEFDNCSEFLIISFSGNIIASVKTKEMAETLVFHLNHGESDHEMVA